MSDEWDTLSWKQKKALRLALKKGQRMSISFLQGVYSTKSKRRQAIKTMSKRGFIESSNIGNKYDIKKDKIPDGVLSSIENKS